MEKIQNPSKDYLEIIDECCFSQFKTKMDEWSHNLIDEENQYSVLSQLKFFIWIYVIYSALEQMKKEADTNKNPEIGINNTIFQLLYEGFYRTQIVGIRSLIDKREDVISLRRIIDDIYDNIHIITRVNYLAYFDLPYDYHEALRKYNEKYRANNSGSMSSSPSNGEYAHSSSLHLHKHFDELSGVNKNNRNRLDIIKRDITIKAWKDRFGNYEVIKKFANKQLCHFSNDIGNLSTVSLDDIKKCLKTSFLIIEEIREKILEPKPLFIHKIVDLKMDTENFAKKWINSDEQAIRLVQTKSNEFFKYLDE